MGMLGHDILIDEEKFTTASTDIATLSGDLNALSKKITELLSTLSKGFDTPSGAIFYNSCEANLLKPIEDQRLVLDHIASVLNTSKSKYQSVFDAYSELNNSISGYSNK